MNRVYILFLFLIIFKIDIQAQQNEISDTSIVVEDCLKKTIIKEANVTTTHTEILDCFWNSGVDTNIIIKDCVKQVIMEKMGHKRIYETNLACYWDDATKQVDTFLIPKYDDKWSLQYSYLYTKPNGETKSSKSTIGITNSEAYRAGLDTLFRKEYDQNHAVFKQYRLIKQNRNTPVSVRDTTVNKQNVLNRVNEIRLDYCQCGDKKMNPTTAIKWSDKLAYVAYMHAKDMHKRRYFDHISPEGEEPGDRIRKSGLTGIAWGGENIAGGQMSGLHAVESWKKSPGHCKNMMGSSHTHVGVARYMDKYVMLLGSDY